MEALTAQDHMARQGTLPSGQFRRILTELLYEVNSEQATALIETQADHRTKAVLATWRKNGTLAEVAGMTWIKNN